MVSDPVTMVANSVHRHDQSIDLGIYDWDTALRPDWTEVALRRTVNISVVMFVDEHSLRVLAVHLAKIWCKYHLSDVAGKCADQSVSHEWHHTTRLRKSDVGSCFRQFHEDYHDPINGIFLYCWPPLRVKWTLSVNKILHIIWELELIQRHSSNWLHMSADEHEKRTTPANSQLCKKHQQRCSAS